jgi:hypothetical protein
MTMSRLGRWAGRPRPSILDPRDRAVSPIEAARGLRVIRIAMRAGRRRPGRSSPDGAARRGSRLMTVRDLACWPPRWRRASNPSAEGTPGERGVLIAARWIPRPKSLSLVMEEGETGTSRCRGQGAGAHHARTPARLAHRPTPCQDWRLGDGGLAPDSGGSLLTTSAPSRPPKAIAGSPAQPTSRRSATQADRARGPGWRRRPRAVKRHRVKTEAARIEAAQQLRRAGNEGTRS